MSPGGKSNAFRGIVAFDLDGTLLRGPTVSELIADGLGRLEQMQDAVEWFASKLNVSDVLGTQHLPSGEIVHVFGRDKARYLREFTATARIARNRVAAVGDSLGDVEMLLHKFAQFQVSQQNGSRCPAV